MVDSDNSATDGPPVDQGSVDHDATTSQVPTPDRLEQLIVDHVNDVAAYCRWRCISTEEARDAVSEVFLVAGHRLGDVPEGNAARVWLLATARRVIAARRRAPGRPRLMERLRLVEPDDPAQWPGEMGLGGGVADALRRLPPADREILLLAEWEGLTATEIGAVMGCLAVIARGRLRRARHRFRSVYHPDETASTGMPSPSPAEIPTPASGFGRRRGR